MDSGAPALRYNSRRDAQNRALLRVLTAGFIVSCLILNYSSLTRMAGAIVLCLVLGLAFWRGRLVARDSLNFLAIFGFLLILFNFVGKFGTIDTSGHAAAGIEFVTPILAFWFLATNFLLHEQSLDDLTKAVDLAVKIFLLICFADLALRLINAGPGCFSLTSGCRTAAKFGGLAFNSNITAVPIVTCLFFARKLSVMALFLVLLYATMNRSGLLALMATLSALVLYDKDIPIISNLSFGVRLLIISPFVALLLMDVAPAIWIYVITDGSFLSKLAFIDSTLYNIQSASWQVLLFGDKLNYLHIVNKYSYNGWSLHLAVLKALWYYGFIGLSFYVLLNIILARLSVRAFCCVLTFLLMGIGGFAIFNSVMLAMPLMSAVFLYQKRQKNSHTTKALS